ncbi:MAG: polysaccharide biosynthesis/export family protein [Rhodospirillales bacterium]
MLQHSIITKTKSPRPGVKTGAKIWAVLLMLGMNLTIAGCAGEPNFTPVAPMNETAGYQLGSGDMVQITVFGDPSLSGERQVDGTGHFAFPLIGQVKASGLKSTELETLLEKQLKDYMRDPNVGVQVMSHRPFYIVGEIRKPGSYPYVNGITVINAIAIAGGFTYRAREGSFYIQRPAQKAQIEAGQATPVRPGDVIIVQERHF